MDTTTDELTSRRIELSDPAEAIEFFYQQGWTDGLPIVPPTPARVKEGWTKEQIRHAVYERAGRPQAEYKRLTGLPDSAITEQDATRVQRYVETLDDLLIVTAGGKAGGFSAIIPPWAAGADSRPVTRAIGVCIDCD